jgi:hypothetical protein
MARETVAKTVTAQAVAPSRRGREGDRQERRAEARRQQGGDNRAHPVEPLW